MIPENTPSVDPAPPEPNPFLGLAPFLRMSLDGSDMNAKSQELLAAAQGPEASADDLMNLSIALLCMGQVELGLSIQAEALRLTRQFHIACSQQPPTASILMLMAPGDLAANTPLECLLEDCGIDIHMLFLDKAAENPIGDFVQEHDALVCAVGESPENASTLDYLCKLLPHWPRPVINDPRSISRVERQSASLMLASLPGVRHARLELVSRAQLEEGALAGSLADAHPKLAYPLLLRPKGSHAGKDLEKIQDARQLRSYARRVAAPSYYACEFIDYQSPDGLHRKMRIAFIDGESFPCHMAASEDWMVHYINAGMYQSAQRREMEREFMQGYDAFKERHALALEAIQSAVGLDYYAIDCALASDGSILVFEIDHAMVIHAMDPPKMFPYKQPIMARAREAAIAMILKKAAQAASRLPQPQPARRP